MNSLGNLSRVLYHVNGMAHAQKKIFPFVILASCIFLGGAFRFTRVNWDSFEAFHPDERNISWAVTRIHFFDQMNPGFFAYGGLPIYLYRALGEVVVTLTHNRVWLADWGHIAVIGRYVSATLSTISILLIYLVGTAYFSRVIGVVSAAFFAFSPWAIQQAHFDTTETMLVFFILLLLFFSYKLLRSIGNIGVLVVLGIIWGLAMAAKTTSVLFGVIPFTALMLSKTYKNSLQRKFVGLLVFLIVSATIFFIFSPYTILDLTHFRESMTYESGVALGRFTVPYTLQFLHTTPYLYQLTTMLWQAGPLVIVGLIGLIGILFSVIPDPFRRSFSEASLIGDLPFWKKTNTDPPVAADDNKKKAIVFLIFPLLYFGWVGSWFAKFNRYNVPFLPFVTIAAAWFMVESLFWLKRTSFIGVPARHRYALALAGGLVYSSIGLFTIWWALANWTVYLRPQTRLTATKWMFTHIPKGAKIYTEHWNDGLPLDLPRLDVSGKAGLPGAVPFNRELLTVYDQDNGAKKIYYADKLVAGDFIILSTRRMWATMPRLGEKYPLTKLFYQRLLDGSLGYKEVATFTSYPQLFGFTINDDNAEESLQVFDHPTVLIFQNTGRYNREQYLQILTP